MPTLLLAIFTNKIINNNNNMRQLKIIYKLVFLLVLSSCNMYEEEHSLDNTTSEKASLELSIKEASNSDMEPQEFIIPEEMKKRGEILTLRSRVSTRSINTDDTFESNMYAIRELPATIKVRSIATNGSTSGYISLYCEGKGKEVKLNNSNDIKKNRFHIEVLPASTGVPYQIYSEASGTPLSVGYYTNKPDEKILMAAKDDNNSLTNRGWKILPTNYNKNYHAIQSTSYLGQADPNNSWSIFYYVLEATSGNKIRYAQRIANKGQQEFIITPDQKFDLISLEYDYESASVSRSTFTKTTTVKNTSSAERNIDVPFDFHEIESSFYNKSTWNVHLHFGNMGQLFKRPSVIKGEVLAPTTSTVTDALFTSGSYQNIDKHIVYAHPIRCKASTIAKVSLQFVKYNVTINYVAKAQCNINGSIRECILKGVWTGSIIEDPKEVTPSETIIYTPIDPNGDIVL